MIDAFLNGGPFMLALLILLGDYYFYFSKKY